MSQKQHILKEIRSAKRAHIAWAGRAELLAKGYPVTEDQVPLSHAECAFGTWYLQASTELKTIGVFRAIDAPHKTLHDAYADIFKALFTEQNLTFFQRMVGQGAKLKEKNKPYIAEKLRTLEKASNEVVALLDEFEEVVAKMPEAEAAELFN